MNCWITKEKKKMATGVVAKWNEQRGYGFLVADDELLTDGRDVFAHFSEIQAQGFKTLIEGQHVSFALQKTPRGWKASRITILPKE
jgi:cold shock protein